MKKNTSSFLIKLLPINLRNNYIYSNNRSKLILKNIALSLVMKIANIICSILLVPLTINYVNSERYGIWLTLSTVIGWIMFFDLGLGHGFRNRFAEAKANNNTILARELVSTTYFAISCVVLLLLLFALIANNHMNWSSFLHLSAKYSLELQKIFAIVVTFTSLNMIVNIFNSLLAADMKPGYSALINGASQYLILFIIYLLTHTTKGSLINLAFCYAGIPVLVTFILSIISFKFTRYRKYSPSIKFIRISQIKNIVNLGIQFALIQVTLIAIFQIINLIITRELGPLAVTQYSIANKYFSIVYMLMNIILTPMWSAFTDAYVKKEYVWMQQALKRLEKIDLLFIGILLFMLSISEVAYHIWIGNTVVIPILLSVSMMLLIVLQCFAGTYMMCINGIGKIRLQLIIYVFCAFISWPLLTLTARSFGIIGITIAPSIVYLLQAISGKIQLTKIINKTDRGIWSK